MQDIDYIEQKNKIYLLRNQKNAKTYRALWKQIYLCPKSNKEAQ